MLTNKLNVRARATFTWNERRRREKKHVEVKNIQMMINIRTMFCSLFINSFSFSVHRSKRCGNRDGIVAVSFAYSFFFFLSYEVNIRFARAFSVTHERMCSNQSTRNIQKKKKEFKNGVGAFWYFTLMPLFVRFQRISFVSRSYFCVNKQNR